MVGEFNGIQTIIPLVLNGISVMFSVKKNISRVGVKIQKLNDFIKMSITEFFGSTLDEFFLMENMTEVSFGTN